MTRFFVAVAGLLALLGLAGGASAQDLEEEEGAYVEDGLEADLDPGGAAEVGPRFDVHLTLGWYAAAGGGLRVDLPVVREGLIDVAEDDLRITLGAEVLWYWSQDDQIGFYPLAALQWNFYLNEQWSVFPEVGFVLMFPRPHFWRTFIAPLVSLGARYHFSPRNAFLVRVSWPHGLQLGVTF